MQQRLVAWGDIGTDHKALIAIEFIALEHMVIFRPIPEEKVNKELQNQLFLVWKNGGEFEFPEDVATFDVKADSETLLPEGIKLHKPELLVNAQRQWNKIQQLEDNFVVLGEKMHILELELDGIKEFNQDLWNKTKALWNEISTQKKEGHLGWSQADELKIRINSVFDGLKAFRRLNKERNFDESNALVKLFQKQITECEEKLIYPDEWNSIFESLKKIQKDMKEAPLIFKHQRLIYDKINGVFNDLRNYRKADQINHVKERIRGLERVLHGVRQSIKRDEGSYENQFEKMKHYTRGKMSDEDIAEQLKYIKEQAKVKNKKVKSIEKTLRNLDNRLQSLMNPPKPKPKAKTRAKKKAVGEAGGEKMQIKEGEVADAKAVPEAPGAATAKEVAPEKPAKKAKGKKDEIVPPVTETIPAAEAVTKTSKVSESAATSEQKVEKTKVEEAVEEKAEVASDVNMEEAVEAAVPEETPLAKVVEEVVEVVVAEEAPTGEVVEEEIAPSQVKEEVTKEVEAVVEEAVAKEEATKEVKAVAEKAVDDVEAAKEVVAEVEQVAEEVVVEEAVVEEAVAKEKATKEVEAVAEKAVDDVEAAKEVVAEVEQVAEEVVVEEAVVEAAEITADEVTESGDETTAEIETPEVSEPEDKKDVEVVAKAKSKKKAPLAKAAKEKAAKDSSPAKKEKPAAQKPPKKTSPRPKISSK